MPAYPYLRETQAQRGPPTIATPIPRDLGSFKLRVSRAVQSRNEISVTRSSTDTRSTQNKVTLECP